MYACMYYTATTATALQRSRERGCNFVSNTKAKYAAYIYLYGCTVKAEDVDWDDRYCRHHRRQVKKKERKE